FPTQPSSLVRHPKFARTEIICRRCLHRGSTAFEFEHGKVLETGCSRHDADPRVGATGVRPRPENYLAKGKPDLACPAVEPRRSASGPEESIREGEGSVL